MKQKAKLSTSMTLAQFDNGYWYTTELKEFAETIGIPSANKLRKDELEKAVKLFLKTGEIKSPTKRTISISGIKDVERGLSLNLPVCGLHKQQGDKRFFGGGSPEAGSWIEKEIWCTLSSDSVTKMCT